MNRKSWKKIFKDPGADYRSKPFWSWTGKMEEKELFRQLDILKEMGFGGAFMHSRVGLATEYPGRRVDEDRGEMPGVRQENRLRSLDL